MLFHVVTTPTSENGLEYARSEATCSLCHETVWTETGEAADGYLQDALFEHVLSHGKARRAHPDRVLL